MAEQRDLSLRAIATFAVSLVVTIVVVLFVSKVIFTWMAQRHAAAQVPPLPVAVSAQAPPQPRLQVNAPADLHAWRAKEDAQLNSYGWVDRDNGIVRIPINRAMELVAQQGLPR
jgi:hypothetical protein